MVGLGNEGGSSSRLCLGFLIMIRPWLGLCHMNIKVDVWNQKVTTFEIGGNDFFRY